MATVAGLPMLPFLHGGEFAVSELAVCSHMNLWLSRTENALIYTETVLAEELLLCALTCLQWIERRQLRLQISCSSEQQILC